MVLEESWLQALCALEQKQRQTKTFVDRRRKQKEKMFEIGKLVLVFQTKMGSMPSKLQFQWTRPFWIVDNKNGTYQLGMLTGEILPQWVNGFRLKLYRGLMPENPFRIGVNADKLPTTS